MSSEDNSVSHNTSDDLVGTARLLNHIKENNVTWLVALLVSYQMGILDKFWTYGTGMC